MKFLAKWFSATINFIAAFYLIMAAAIVIHKIELGLFAAMIIASIVAIITIQYD